MIEQKKKSEFKLDKEIDFKLESEQEFRFEVETNEKLIIELTDGFAEMFGTELIKGIKYQFVAGSKNAIFSYHGCTINVSFYYIPIGDLANCQSSYYTSKETPMIFYLNVHGYLEKLRDELKRKGERGPNVLLCGPVDVGKSTLCKILLNYAVGCGRTPVYVDLDVGQGNIGIPGTIGCNIIEKPCDIETGFSDQAPLLLHYGDKSLDSNVNLFKMLVGHLAEIITMKMDEDPIVRESGCIINTGGWITGGGLRLLLFIAQKLEANIVLALDQEKLYNELVRDLPPKSTIKVLFTPKSGGVVSKAAEHRRESRDKRIREYFYGSKMKETGSQLYPHSFDIAFSLFKIYQIGAPEVPNSCLPLGMRKDDHHTQVVKIEPSMSILNHILSLASTNEPSEIIRSCVRGFVCVTNVDTDRQMITVISPQPRDKLPSNPVFILSKIQYLDNQ